MLSESDMPVSQAVMLLAPIGIPVSFISPTETGMKKSIMDAIEPLREFLSTYKIHNYYLQEKGPANKVLVPTYFVEANGLVETTTSLYRPVTKDGDPRIWFYNLGKYCIAHNLLAIFQHDGKLYVVNLSDEKIHRSVQEGYVGELLRSFTVKNPIAQELIQKIYDIGMRGFIPTMRNGDTGIGATLETELGIKSNCSKKPDYKGIELKSKRTSKDNHLTLFAQVPDWKGENLPSSIKPKVKSAEELLDAYGYVTEKDGRRRLDLNVTIGMIPNKQGLFLKVDYDLDVLEICHTDGTDTEVVAAWTGRVLRERFATKHKETFWVEAESRIVDGIEEFHYTTITHTRFPGGDMLFGLIEAGAIIVEPLYHRGLDDPKDTHMRQISLRISGRKGFDMVFSNSTVYDLTQDKVPQAEL